MRAGEKAQWAAASRILRSSRGPMGGLAAVAVLASILAPLGSHAIRAPQGNRNAPSLVEGVLQISGQQFKAVCECRDLQSSRVQRGEGVCAVQKILISKDHGSTGISAEQVRVQMGDPRNVQMAPAISEPLACASHRGAVPALFALGGDLGEFLLALAVYADAGGGGGITGLDDAAVRSLLQQFIEEVVVPANRKFLFCTDETTVLRLETQLKLTGGLSLENPPPRLQAELTAALAAAGNQGDAHFRSIMAGQNLYGTGATELAAKVVQAFYSLWWESGDGREELTARKKTLGVDVFPAAADAPQAIVEIDEGAACHAAGRGSLVTPALGTMVLHKNAAADRRTELAKFFTARGAEVDAATFRSRLNRRAAQWMEATLTAGGSILFPFSAARRFCVGERQRMLQSIREQGDAKWWTHGEPPNDILSSTCSESDLSVVGSLPFVDLG